MSDSGGKRVIFECNDWKIIEDTRLNLPEVYCSHNQCQENEAHAWFKDEPPMCYYCDKEVPESIQGLMHLLESF